MLAIDERIIFFAVLVAMCNDYFYIFSLEVYDRIQALSGHILIQQVQQSVTGKELFTVEYYRKS